MCFKATGTDKWNFTHLTFEWFFPSMDAHMIIQMSFSSKGLFANVTFKVLFSSVCAHVDNYVSAPWKCPSTYLTFESLLAMAKWMFSQTKSSRKRLVTYGAFVLKLIRLYVHFAHTQTCDYEYKVAALLPTGLRIPGLLQKITSEHAFDRPRLWLTTLPP